MRYEQLGHIALFPARVAWSPVRWLITLPERRRWIAVLLLSMYWFVAFMIPVGDDLNYTAAESASASHRYGLLSFEIRNLTDKWTHRIYMALPWTDTSTEDMEAQLARYEELVVELRAANYELLQASSAADPDIAQVEERQSQVDALLDERDRLKDGVEEYLESRINDKLRENGLNVNGRFTWPPVDFRLDNPPSVLIISPRDEISRVETILIDPNISAEEMERIEAKLLEENNLSAVILRTGGLASYPTVIPSDRDLLPLLEVAAHEWLHAYLFFHKLGRSFFSGGEMVTINETLANLFGDEIGGETWADITGNPAPERPAPANPDDPVETPDLPDPDRFDFFRFMRETRIKTDDLLAEGDVDGAESWMEERRLELQTHGYFIRKINQAYFAFTGSYGDNPGSVSPIARQIWELRQQEDSVGDLIKALQGISTYSQFEAVLDERGITVGRQ